MFITRIDKTSREKNTSLLVTYSYNYKNNSPLLCK